MRSPPDAVHRNAAVIRSLFDAFARKDGLPLRDLFAEDATWTVPGEGVMAGTVTGREAIIRFLGRLPRETAGTYRSSLVDVLASPERAAAVYRAFGERHGRSLDILQVLLFRIDDGLISEVLALPGDPGAFEAFWAPSPE
jgi:ketosteroid isomerase-like protein